MEDLHTFHPVKTPHVERVTTSYFADPLYRGYDTRYSAYTNALLLKFSTAKTHEVSPRPGDPVV